VDAVIWHDVECGGYSADLPLWRELADEHGGPVLDLGAGTGRVALDLAHHGHDVVALDVDATLLRALAERAGPLPVTTIHADARAFDLPGRTFPLILAPMQTVQLLGGAAARVSMLESVRRHLEPDGLFAAALANALDTYGEVDAPVPDMREVAGVVYASRPTAVREAEGGFVLERLRERVSAGGERSVSENRIRLDRVTPAQLHAEGRALGLTPAGTRWIDETDDHVGSEVALLHG
jgi:SAM-dependent methyltransferase